MAWGAIAAAGIAAVAEMSKAPDMAGPGGAPVLFGDVGGFGDFNVAGAGANQSTAGSPATAAQPIISDTLQTALLLGLVGIAAWALIKLFD